MTKKEENPQSLNISFKIKLIKKERPKLNLGNGLYQQIRGKPVPYNQSSISLADIEKALGGYFSQNQNQRRTKIITTEAGMEMFNEALKKEFLKMTNNEHRKKFSFRSKIFKQTYKFG